MLGTPEPIYFALPAAFPACAVLLAAVLLSAPEAAGARPFARENLVVNCTLGPDAPAADVESLAETLRALGITKVACAWPEGHGRDPAEGVAALEERGIELVAVREPSEAVLGAIEGAGVRPQVWVSIPDVGGGLRDQKTRATGIHLLGLARRLDELGCPLGLDNGHGGWPAEPCNMAAVCRWLRTHGALGDVGLVYSVAPEQADADRLGAALERLGPDLLCLNLHGLPAGAEAALHAITRSGYDGPIGLLHRPGEDAAKLRETVEALERTAGETRPR